MTTQNLWDAAKAVKKKKSLQQYNPTSRNNIKQSNFTPKTTRKEQKPPKISRRKEITKIQAEIHEKEVKETIVKINKTKSWFFEKINKIGKPLARLIKKKREESNQQNQK